MPRPDPAALRAQARALAPHLARAIAALLLVGAAALVLVPAGQRPSAFMVGALAVLMLAARAMRSEGR